MSGFSDNLARLTPSQRAELEERLLRFDRSWTPGTLDSQLHQLDGAEPEFRDAALAELVKVDMEHWWTSGRERKVEDYLALLPELGDRESVLPTLIFAEYQIRVQVGRPVNMQKIEQRFPDQCAQVERLIEQSSQSAVAQKAHAEVEANIDTSRPGHATETAAGQPISGAALPENFGRYRILRQLGAGAMGAVYLAHDTQLDRQVALKTPSFGGHPNPELVKRFYREARSAANLRHPNICPVHDVGELDGVHFITMAYIEGRPLSAYIRPEKLIPERTAAALIRKLALALAHAHEQGVIHRDVKPANIMVDKNREPMVMDFGLALRDDHSEQSRMTQSGMILGTPAYMSPEQVEGQPDQIGPACDQYSLGVILYELLTAELPFRGSVAAVIGKIMTQKPPRPKSHRADLDEAIEAICLKMIAKQSADRFGSMKEVATALARYISGKKASPSDPPDARPGAAELIPQALPVATSVPAALPAKSAIAANAGSTASNPRSVDEQLQQFLAIQSPEQRELGKTAGPAPPTHGDPPVAQGPRKPRQSLNVTQQAVSLWKSLPPIAKWSVAVVPAAILLLAGIILLVPTSHGTLQLEIEDGLEVAFDDRKISVTSQDKSVRLKPGQHQFEVLVGQQRLKVGQTIRLETAKFEGDYQVAVQLGDVMLSADELEFARGGKTVLRVQLQPTVTRPSENDSVGQTSVAQPVNSVNLPTVSPAHAASSPPVQLVSVTKIWDSGQYGNKFPDLIIHDGALVCALMEGRTRAGRIRVIRSIDGQRWTSVALIEASGIGFSVPTLSLMPDGQLMIVAHGISGRSRHHVSYVMFSRDGVSWTEPQAIQAEDSSDERLWRVDWYGVTGYAVAYRSLNATDPRRDRILSLYWTRDGIYYNKICELNVTGEPSETAVRIMPDGEMLLLVRRDEESRSAWVGSSRSPYRTWTWVEVGHRIAGPNFIASKDGRLWAVGRDYAGGEGLSGETRTALAVMTRESYEPVLRLPSGSDTGYAGLAWKDGLLWVAYHSSHDRETAVYLAKLDVTSGQREADDWITLFDGTSLNAWRGYEQPTIGASWRIENGHLVHDADGRGDLVTKRSFRNFELEFEWMVERQGNSGVLYRVPLGESTTYNSGLEYQILDDPRFASQPEQHLTSSIYGLYERSGGTLYPFAQFNRGKIKVVDNQIEHWLNGTLVTQAQFGSADWNRRRQANERYRDNPQHGLYEVGRIALQDHGSKVWFRDIRIRELP